MLLEVVKCQLEADCETLCVYVIHICEIPRATNKIVKIIQRHNQKKPRY